MSSEKRERPRGDINSHETRIGLCEELWFVVTPMRKAGLGDSERVYKLRIGGDGVEVEAVVSAKCLDHITETIKLAGSDG